MASIPPMTAAGISAVVSFVAGVIPRIGAALAALPGLLVGAFNNALNAARNAVSAGVNAIVATVSAIPGRISALAGALFAAGRNLIAALFGGLGQGGGFVGDLASRIVGAIRGFLNRVISQLNAGIGEIDAVLPGTLPRIPLLQAGGVTTGTGLAVLHPQEAILPLDSTRAVDLLARALADADARLRTSAEQPGGDTFVWVEIDGEQLQGRIVRTVRTENDEQARSLRRQVAAAGQR